MNRKLNQLKKAYNKRFKLLNKNMLIEGNAGLLIFIEHLKYLRDVYTITQASAETVISINTALEEFEMYRNTHKEFHWNNFCEFVKLNMGEWLSVNDSI
jgi:hypothetical protein